MGTAGIGLDMGSLDIDRCWPTSVPMLGGLPYMGTIRNIIGKHGLPMFGVIGSEVQQYRSTSVADVLALLLTRVPIPSNIGQHGLPMFSVTPYMGTDTSQHRSTSATYVERFPLCGYRC